VDESVESSLELLYGAIPTVFSVEEIIRKAADRCRYRQGGHKRSGRPFQLHESASGLPTTPNPSAPALNQA
jgi:hypothetical protein